MGIRIIGAILIIGTCSALGFKMSANYKLQERQMEQLVEALLYISCEMSYRLTPLAQQFSGCCAITTGAVKTFFYQASRELSNQISPNASCCIQAALDKTSGLTPAAIKTIKQIGNTLGEFDLDGQLKALEETLILCRNTLSHLKAEQAVHTRNYQTLGICAGAALAILFI